MMVFTVCCVKTIDLHRTSTAWKKNPLSYCWAFKPGVRIKENKITSCQTPVCYVSFILIVASNTAEAKTSESKAAWYQ